MPDSVREEALDISKIRVDGGTQIRVNKIDSATVSDYVDAMNKGEIFPPVAVFFDGTNYWLVDGFHRRAAALRRGEPTMKAEVIRKAINRPVKTGRKEAENVDLSTL
jgi:uncharacterized ParB-like nuclease family protein